MTELRELNPDFRDVLLAFSGEGVEFVVVGAHALALDGVPRATGDLDVLVRPSKENAARVWRARVRFGAPSESVGVTMPGEVASYLVHALAAPSGRPGGSGGMASPREGAA